MVYQWKTIKYNVDAQKAGEEIERISKKKSLTAENIVEESKPAASPLHPIFEWDNSKAGDEWRKQQARVLLGNLVTVNIENKTISEPTRAFVDISKNEREYTSIEIVLGDHDLYNAYVEKALRDLNNFKKKYEGIQCLEKHFPILEKFESAIKKDLETVTSEE